MDRPTKVILGEKARQVILRGVNIVYDAVRLTLGPQGANALLYRTYNRGGRVTNDGHTIAQVIEPRDESEALVSNFSKKPLSERMRKPETAPVRLS